MPDPKKHWWTKLALTYSFGNFSPDLSTTTIQNVVRAAFNRWAQVSSFTFSEVASNGDMQLSWQRLDHGDGVKENVFDGPGGTLAHASYPPKGRIHFDEDETWSIPMLARVALHEIGHALGLAHSPFWYSVMYRFDDPSRDELTSDEITRIRSLYGVLVPGWFGEETQGADIAVADISGNGKPDLVIFHIDNPAGENHGYYRVGWDLDATGSVAGWSPKLDLPGWFGSEDQGAGIAIADLNGNGRPDLIVFYLDNPDGENQGYYRIGWDLDKSGQVTRWSEDPIAVQVTWFGAENQGAGIAIADISGSGMPDLVVFYIDNPEGENKGYYRIGWDLDASGNVTGDWSQPIEVPGWFGTETQGAGIAIGDIDGDGTLGMIVFHIDNKDGENSAYLRIGQKLDHNGKAGRWMEVKELEGWFGAESQGGGVALARVGARTLPSVIAFHVDNPHGENHGYYHVHHLAQEFGVSIDQPVGESRLEIKQGGWRKIRTRPCTYVPEAEHHRRAVYMRTTLDLTAHSFGYELPSYVWNVAGTPLMSAAGTVSAQLEVKGYDLALEKVVSVQNVAFDYQVTGEGRLRLLSEHEGAFRVQIGVQVDYRGKDIRKAACDVNFSNVEIEWDQAFYLALKDCARLYRESSRSLPIIPNEIPQPGPVELPAFQEFLSVLSRRDPALARSVVSHLGLEHFVEKIR